jgi:hypothetical protein
MPWISKPDMTFCYKEMLREEKLQAKQSVLAAFFNKKADDYFKDDTQLDLSSSI